MHPCFSFSGIDQFIILSSGIGQQEINVVHRHANHPKGIVGQTKAALYSLGQSDRRSRSHQPAARFKVSGPCNNGYSGAKILYVGDGLEGRLFAIHRNDNKGRLFYAGLSSSSGLAMSP